MTDARQARLRAWRWAALASLALLVVAIATLVPHLTDSAELVRLRNALLVSTGDAGSGFAWTPETIPADFKLERGPAHPRFATVVRDLGVDSMPSDWDRAIAIGRHLLSRVGPHSGGPIQADLETTYRRIVERGEGYCGDFVDVFTGLALAAGVPVRAWAFSFDGFGGNGHIFNEIWDRNARAWRMIDVFNNYVFVREDGTPVSALEFRSALQRGGSGLALRPVEPRAPPRFRYEDKAWAYYERGLPEWYLWWGNDVFTYDRAPLVRLLGPVSRSLEQLGGIASDVHPGLRVLADSANEPQRKSLLRLRWQLLATLALAIVAIACIAGLVFARRNARHGR